MIAWSDPGPSFEHTGITFGGFTKNKRILHRLPKIRYAFAGSVILFGVITPFFILPSGNLMDFNKFIVSNYLLILPLSIIIGFPYLKVNFLYLDQDGFISVREDRKDKFVKWGAILKRLLLILALVITFAFVIEGFKAGMGLWASLYALIFISTALPNIIGKIRLAMIIELIGLSILIYGSLFFSIAKGES